MTALIRMVRVRRSLIAVLCVALAGLVLAGTAFSEGSTVFRFHFESSESFPTALPECMPADLVGIQSVTEITDGLSVESEGGGSHIHGTTAFPYRVDFPDGSFVLGSGVEHFDFNFRPGGTVTNTSVIKEPRTIYDASGDAVGRVVIHADSHLTFHDANSNGVPDQGEVTASMDKFFFTCA